MIFLDETGKRWRRIKRSTAGLTALATVPAIALIGGSLAYQPHWGGLPIIKQVAVALPHTSTIGSSSVSVGKTAKSTALAAAGRKSGNSTDAAAVSTPTPVLAAVVSQPVSAPHSNTTTSPASTTSPTGGNPTQNDYGQSHKPTR